MANTGGSMAAASPPTVTTLLASDASYLLGVTADYFAVYAAADGSIRAVSLSGGTPVTIAAPFAGRAYGLVDGRTVVAASGEAVDAPLSLTTWTSTAGTHSMEVTAIDLKLGATEPDGKRVVLHMTGQGFDGLVGSDVELAHPVALGPGHSVGTCSAGAWYAGGRFVTATCSDTSVLATMSSWDAAWKPTVLFDDRVRGDVFATEAFGGNMIAPVSSPNSRFDLQRISVTGGTPVTIGSGVFDYVLSADAQVAMYDSVSTPSHFTRTDSPNPVELAPSNGIVAGNGGDGYFAADDTHLIYRMIYSVWLTALPDGTPVKLSPDGDTGTIIDRGFTADSRFALYADDSGMQAYDVAKRAGRPIVDVATFARPELYATRGSNVIAYAGTTKQLLAIDLSATAAPTVLAENVGKPSVVETYVSLTPARDALAWIVTGGATPGLYGAPVP
jgi:hypothetical protein